MSYTINLQHIVFRTYRSRFTIPEDSKRMMFKYIYELCQSEGWYLLRINAYLNHVHILLDIPATAKVAEVVQKIKANSSKSFSHHRIFPYFEGWARKYGAFSVSYSAKPDVIEYIRNQEKHHQGESFEDEMRRLFRENGITDVEEFLKDDEPA
ncbi:MAG: transposase [Bacteroidales bacterium]|nr:transposase [Bacteroidales bacterium]